MPKSPPISEALRGLRRDAAKAPRTSDDERAKLLISIGLAPEDSTDDPDDEPEPE